MKKKCEMLIEQLKSDLEDLEVLNLSSIELLKLSASRINNALIEMKAWVAKGAINSEDEEIEFFKKLKPQVYGQLIFVLARYNYETSKPALLSDYSNHTEEQLKYIKNFFRQHEFMYQYFQLGMIEMDSLYFVRGKNAEGIIGIELPDLDPIFATPGDYLFSKFIAYERLQGMLLSSINKQASGDIVIESKKGRKLKWTGDTTNLIELMYGLFETKQFNEGNIDISDMVDIFEQVFNTNLSNYFRRFTTIKRRKSVSKTRFLDEMRDAVAKRIDDADAYVPNWAK